MTGVALFGDRDKKEGSFNAKVELKNYEETVSISSEEQTIAYPIEGETFTFDFQNPFSLEPNKNYTFCIQIKVY